MIPEGSVLRMIPPSQVSNVLTSLISPAPTALLLEIRTMHAQVNSVKRRKTRWTVNAIGLKAAAVDIADLPCWYGYLDREQRKSSGASRPRG